MFVGFDTFVQVAKEIDLPFRDIGAVLLASVAMAIVWYGLIVLAVGLVLDQPAIGFSTAGTAEANARIYGEAGGQA